MSRLIFKILKPSATFHGLDYNERKSKKGGAVLLHYDNFGLLQNETPTKKVMKAYMDLLSSTNKRIRNKQFHAILSCKEKTYALEELKSYALEIVSQLGYQNNPIVIYGHSDTTHHHVHIITTRVGIDGKKVPHQFEGKRGNEIVSQMLQTDKQQLFNMDLEHALSYQFSTMTQFQLLMEQKGYDTKKNDDELCFYKYGSLQGAISVDQISKTLNNSIIPGTQMRAIIYKYKNSYDTKSIQDQKARGGSFGEKYSTKKKVNKTALTEALHQKFGWEFVFFINSKHDKPYGYTVIDHSKKTVYKGNDLIPLNTLLSLSPIEEIQDQKSVSIKTDTIQQGQPTNIEILSQDNPALNRQTKVLPPILKAIDRLISESEFNAEQEEHKAHDTKRRRGRFL